MLAGLSIGEVGVLYEYCIAHLDPSSRKANGQFFTPDDVSKFMVAHTRTFPKGRWLDPCSGIGNLSWHLVNAQKDKEKFLIQDMVLSDKDGLALEIARVLFTLSFQKNHPALYNEVKNSFVPFDFLSVADSGQPTLFSGGALKVIPSHDYVIVNPPYLGLKKEDSRFETAKAKDLYAYFLENIIKTSKGFVSVTPQSFTNADKFSSLRSLLISRYPTLKIYTFDNIPGNIFYGVKFGSANSNSANSMRAAITIASLSPGKHEITSLIRWKSSERQVMFRNLDRFLSEPGFSATYFPKVSANFAALFKQVQNRPALGTLLSSKPTPHVLYVPSAPRYFISALKKPVSRSSMKTIYFKNAQDMERAYLLLNSSFMYWWWRVRDGGMTLALETIVSLPVPDFTPDYKLIEELEKSEISNIVYKKNAGALHENVKHNRELVFKINQLVVPKFAKKLSLTHENSDLAHLGDLELSA
ncbi:N-6 DNA methylase [Candidatus Rhodoluna planktonica]|uniref:N-6 DNA methylase n=1 Tax=Candidatus Rhodoluna planktonica TaxID=535712 RepID=UPI00131471A8|nr:N-6 DNA methylase [Candidatus Rhodoluna planktonica]